ncbi:MAG: siphovirus Gp157 family protein [Polyangiaceae bacterium]|nr:siphovirus Gp157 family protein [Polyangiaceae bacterium]
MSDVSRRLIVEGDAAKALLANIRDVIGDDEDMALTAVEGETSLIETITNAVDRMNVLDAYTEALNIQIKTLSERKSRFEAQHDRIKAAVCVAMQQANLRKLELHTATLSIKAVAAKAEITDEALIPSKFWKAADPKLDRKALLDALKAKEAVPGATLSNGGETLSIRGG